MNSGNGEIPRRQRSQWIFDTLRSRIGDGVYVAGSVLPAERTLAEEFDVARATVRSALARLAEEGLTEARQGLGNLVLRQPDAVSQTSIGVIVLRIDNPFFSVLSSHIERALAEHGMSMVLSATDHNAAAEERAMERMLADDVAGVLLWSVQDLSTSPGFRALLDSGIPVVALGGAPGGMNISSVFADHRSGVVAAIDYLASLGHERIGYICALPDGMIDGRMQAARELLTLRGMSHEWLIDSSGIDYEGGKRGMERLLAMSSRPTAVMTINDITAIGAMHQARAQGLNVPGDISIVGFDDIPMAAMLETPLTTVRVPLGELARLAVHRLLEQRENRQIQNHQISIRPTLTIRQSTGPAPCD